MKKSFLICLSLIVMSQLKAQQIPLYSNYFFTPYIYNPALSGSQGTTEATLVHRRMWSGLQGSPETSALAINGAMGKQRIGWSGYIYSDKTDILSRVGMYASYAYHVQLSAKNVLSFGLGAGYVNQSIDLSSVNVGNRLDPVLFISPNDRGSFDLNFGMNLKIDQFNIGVAMPQVLGSSVKYSENYGGEVFFNLIRHYIGTAQYDLHVQGNRMVLSPYVQIRAADNVPFQFDAGAMFSMKKYGFVGASWRNDYAVTTNIGYYLTPQLTLGYAHDFSLNTYASQLGTSNEFMLSWSFGENSKMERLENEIKKLKENDRRKMEQYEEMLEERLEEMEDEIKVEEAARKAGEEAAKETLEEYLKDNPNIGQGGGGGTTAASTPAESQTSASDQTSAGTKPAGSAATTLAEESLPTNTKPGTRGFYVVAGVYSGEANAVRMVENIAKQGMEAGFFRDSASGFYYVYLRQFGDYKSAKQAKNNRLNGTYKGQLWIKIIN